MKRSCIALLLVFALALSGCGIGDIFGRRSNEPPPPTTTVIQSGTIEPAELGESELEILNLYGVDADDWDTFFFSAPEGTGYVELTLRQLDGGKWKTVGMSRFYNAKYGRIALSFDADALTLQCNLIDDFSGGKSLGQPMPLAAAEEGVSWGWTSLGEQLMVGPDEPVAIWLGSSTSESMHGLYDPRTGFTEPERYAEGYEDVFAFTVEFKSEAESA